MIGRSLRVAVLFGGPSREHGVSLASGRAVTAALDEAGLRALPVTIVAGGRWTLPAAVPTGEEPASGGESAGATPGVRALAPASAVGVLAGTERSGPVDAVFVALHGAYGEDGTVQGLLETAGIAYTGSGVAASALAMDKERTKEVLSHHGVRTPAWGSVTRREWEADEGGCVERLAAATGFPAVVKPPREGSSFGIGFADDAAGLRAAVAETLAGPGGRALVEQRIRGVELTCPVLGNQGGPLETLPLVEIVPRGRDFFDFAAKYEGESDEICPARIGEDVAKRVRETSLTAHRILGCDGLSRSDFVVDDAGQPWFLEINTVPGMTPASLCPLSARAAGMSFPDLCRRLVELALERRA